MSILQQGAGSPRHVTVQHPAGYTGDACSGGGAPLDVREPCELQPGHVQRAMHLTAGLSHRHASWQTLPAGRGTVRRLRRAGNGTKA